MVAPAAPTKRVVMSGMRPTGRLHLGNYWGALKNWVSLQHEYRCFFGVVDWHMLTTGYDDTASLRENVREIVLDWLAAGVDPNSCVLFRQSSVMEHAELALLLSMVTPLSWLENNPTWKEQLQEISKMKSGPEILSVASGTGASPEASFCKPDGGNASGKEWLRTYGFLGYPVLQAADILMYRGELVPVGQDQLPHLELTREIARRFNALYGPVLIEPQPIMTLTPKVPGLDGRKMSKSYGNAVNLFETRESLKAKVMAMYTDPLKARADDPGHPEPCPENPPGCVVYSLHKLYSGHWQSRGAECRGGRMGCVACKKDLLGSMSGAFDRFRAARDSYSQKEGLVEEILAEGSRKAGVIAQETMEGVRRAIRLK